MLHLYHVENEMASELDQILNAIEHTEKEVVAMLQLILDKLTEMHSDTEQLVSNTDVIASNTEPGVEESP